MKNSARKERHTYKEELTTEAETAVHQRNMKRLYEITISLLGKNSNPSRPVKDENRTTISTKEERRARWAEHFEEKLNRFTPSAPPDIPQPSALLDVNTNPPSKAEVAKAINSLKS